ICRDTNITENFLLKWIKPNLQREETLFLYRNDGILQDQDESFRNRVSLNNSQMKDGDLSVVLENVTINDTGTYECRVIHRDDSQREWNLISTINLQVAIRSDSRIESRFLIFNMFIAMCISRIETTTKKTEVDQMILYSAGRTEADGRWTMLLFGSVLLFILVSLSVSGSSGEKKI
uniref:Ig-like domain-containing protein n=1 Tax=Oryzias melastigma TaxID=30732 RepID=A0A3B3BNT4_ORYME